MIPAVGTVKLAGIHSFSTRNQFLAARTISALAGMSISGTSWKSLNLTAPLDLHRASDPSRRQTIVGGFAFAARVEMDDRFTGQNVQERLGRPRNRFCSKTDFASSAASTEVPTTDRTHLLRSPNFLKAFAATLFGGLLRFSGSIQSHQTLAESARTGRRHLLQSRLTSCD